MKKYISLLMAFIVVLSLALGCIPQQGTTPTAAPTASSTSKPTTTPTSNASPTSVPTTTGTSPLAELKVHFIDVGQGDSILIDSGQTEVLIDGGEASPGVVSYLKNFVDGPLEIMVATHPHADHIGGLTAVLNAYQVQQIWYNGETSTSQTYTKFMAAVQAENADVHVGKRGDRITTGSLVFTLLNPVTLTGTTNNNSIVLNMEYGKVGFLFTGDAEKEAEGAMLVAADMPVPDIEILKVGHHGSRTASSKDFLAASSPEVAVYMAGKGNTYGHPHQETLDALAQIGAKVYGTDVNGTILISTDGITYTVATQK